MYNHLFTASEREELFYLLVDTKPTRYGENGYPWTDTLLDIKNYLEDRLETKFNAAEFYYEIDQGAIKLCFLPSLTAIEKIHAEIKL